MPPPNITLELPVARKCAFQRVNLCMLAIAKNISPGVEKVKHLAEKEGDLARDKYEDGEFVSTDKFILKTPGRLKYGYIRESSDGCFQCSTIYNNTTSGLIWVESQVLLGGNKNVMVKSQSSKYLSYQATDEVFHYHCNNRLLWLTSIVGIVNIKGSLRLFWELDTSIKMLVRSGLFKILYTCKINLWCIVLYTGLREVRMNYPCGIFHRNILCGCTIA